ncbi:MAG: DNA polymerase IV [Promethearchaeota archaeon]|nr:MAG: DNA polymerase IV [Candidatus Lokiarchaeota archaeon]
MPRIIFHCDLDCFFAAVEIRDNPEYRDKPVIIGADPKGGKGRGVVATCSYEARNFGLHSAMPISKAFRLCPHGVFLEPNHEKYYLSSQKVMKILNSYSPIFQKMGIDEAYLDMTDICSSFDQAEEVAKKIQEEILNRVGISLSIGCASSKSIAKIASDFNKPNGVTIVKDNERVEFLKNMDIKKIPGIGQKSKIYYNKKGIYKIGHILQIPLYQMIEKFGKNGEWVWNIVHGLDAREVKEFHDERKSISKERTFYEDTDDFSEILSKLEEINDKIHLKLEKENIIYRTITLKIRFEGFLTYTRSHSLKSPINNKEKVLRVIIDLIKEFRNNNKKVRLVGIKLSNLELNVNQIQTNILSFIQL